MPIIDSCSWDRPGISPYEGSLAAHVRTMPIPEPYKSELVAKVKALKDYRMVNIYRDGVNGVMPTFMPFGRKGKVCKTVTMSTWGPKDFQPAMLFRAGPYGVGVPPVCRNATMFIFEDPPHEPPSDPPLGPPGEPPADSPPAPNGRQDDREGPPGAPGSFRSGRDDGGPADSFRGGSGSDPVWGGTVPSSTWYVISTVPMPASAVPEPSTWWMIAAGVLTLLGMRRKIRTP